MRTLTSDEHAELLTIRDELLTALTEAMAQRDQRPLVVQDGARFMPAWVDYERTVMHDAVNAHRARYGLDGVDVSEVIRAEDQARGHIDYAAKWAAGCARLAIGLEW